MPTITTEKQFQKTVQNLITTYTHLANKFSDSINVECFIRDVLFDFINDEAVSVIDSPSEYFPETWKDYDEYAKDVKYWRAHKRNAIINLYLDFLNHARDLSSASVLPDNNDEPYNADNYTTINDISSDYYFGDFGGSIANKPDQNQLHKLSYPQRETLNRILAKANLKPVKERNE